MFRDTTRAKLSPHNFSVGSIIAGSPSQGKFVVVGLTPNRVAVMSLKTFMLVEDSSVEVQDPNFLSGAEARQVVNCCGLNYTFTDYDLDPKGLKND